MKVLGEKSLSSKVENGLKILFCIIAFIDIITFIVCAFNLFSNFTSMSMVENCLSKILLETIISIVILSTGIVALFIIYQFILVFKNLRENKLFESNNIKYLRNVSRLSVVISILYICCLVATSIILRQYGMFDTLNNILIETLILVFAIVFLVFGVGIKILNEIYKKAIEYKEENEFTI